MKIITKSMVERHLSVDTCIAAMRRAMIAVSRDQTTLPLRQFMPIPGFEGKMAMMPGTMEDPSCFGIKLVCKYVREAHSVYGTHVGMVMVFDSERGVPLAMIEGSSLTSIRTASASALATDLMANEDCDTLLIMGCGEQARRHIISMLAVRDPNRILVWGRAFDRACAFADAVSEEIGRKVTAVEKAETSVKDADLICTTTSAKTPIIFGEWVQDGSHINLVGSAIPSTREADEVLVSRSRFMVDYTPAAMAAAGELLSAIKTHHATANHIVGEIGAVADGRIPGRTSDSEITVYKSLGVSAQDLAAGHILYEHAVRDGFGLDVDMMDLQ